MTSRGYRRAVAVGVALSGVLLSTTACQDSVATDRDRPAVSASSTSSSDTPVPVPEPEPTVEPADGPLIDVPGAAMRGLKGYRQVGDYGMVQLWGDNRSAVILSPHSVDAGSLDAWAEEYARERIGKKHAERLEDAVVGGTYSAWVIADTKDPLVDERIYGVMHLDVAWTIDFAFYETAQPRPLTQQARQEAIDRMLATFETHREP